MPESKTDQAHRTLEEISNFHDCGDARGSEWLDLHPNARERADQQLRELTHHESEPASAPQQRVSP
jgi:hypothetical protein